MPSAIVKELEVTGVPCLVVVSTRPLAENEEITLDLGCQLEVREGIKKNLRKSLVIHLFLKERKFFSGTT